MRAPFVWGVIVAVVVSGCVSESAVSTVTSAAVGSTVPDVRGLALAEATEMLVSAGLVAEAAELDSDESDSVVRAQEPAAGLIVDRGSVVGLRTLTVTHRTCRSQVFGPQLPSVQGVTAIGAVTFGGLEGTQRIPTDDLAPDANGRFPAFKMPTQLDAGTGPVWVVLPTVNDPPGGESSLLYDRSRFRGDGRYLVADGTQAVLLDRCSTATHTQYNGGFVLAAPVCLDVWVYDGSLRAAPVTDRIGFGTTCS